MAIIIDSNQYKFSKRGPLDAKALVKTYSELLNLATWTSGNTVFAYNGMITAVWLNKEDASKNGIYFLHDPEVTSVLKTPDVTNEANWHKLGGINDLPGLTDQISTIQNELNQVKSDIEELQDAATITVDEKAQLPTVGKVGKLYIVAEDRATYIWYKGAYEPVGDGDSGDDAQIQVINGGNA